MFANWRNLQGYTLTSLNETNTGLTALLNLAGPECNAFGKDVANLTLEVTYDSQSRSVCPYPLTTVGYNV